MIIVAQMILIHIGVLLFAGKDHAVGVAELAAHGFDAAKIDVRIDLEDPQLGPGLAHLVFGLTHFEGEGGLYELQHDLGVPGGRAFRLGRAASDAHVLISVDALDVVKLIGRTVGQGRMIIIGYAVLIFGIRLPLDQDFRIEGGDALEIGHLLAVHPAVHVQNDGLRPLFEFQDHLGVAGDGTFRRGGPAFQSHVVISVDALDVVEIVGGAGGKGRMIVIVDPGHRLRFFALRRDFVIEGAYTLEVVHLPAVHPAVHVQGHGGLIVWQIGQSRRAIHEYVQLVKG